MGDGVDGLKDDEERKQNALEKTTTRKREENGRERSKLKRW